MDNPFGFIEKRGGARGMIGRSPPENGGDDGGY
jgi:hypothetical protein